MVVVFVVCWIPLNGLWIYIDIKSTDKNFNIPYLEAIFFTCHIVAMSSAVYNPLLYAWLNDTFRRNLRSLLPCQCAKVGLEDVAPTQIPEHTRANSILRKESVRDGLAKLDASPEARCPPTETTNVKTVHISS